VVVDGNILEVVARRKLFAVTISSNLSLNKHVSEVVLGNLSQTRAICVTASREMTCFLFDKLCDFTVQNFVEYRIATMEHKQIKKEARLS